MSRKSLPWRYLAKNIFDDDDDRNYQNQNDLIIPSSRLRVRSPKMNTKRRKLYLSDESLTYLINKINKKVSHWWHLSLGVNSHIPQKEEIDTWTHEQWPLSVPLWFIQDIFFFNIFAKTEEQDKRFFVVWNANSEQRKRKVDFG